MRFMLGARISAVADATYNFNGAFKPTTKRFADIEGPDFFPTPPWATHALLEVEKFTGDVWECACGDGAMSEVLKKYGNSVQSSDLFDRGYGESGVDFLKSARRAENIVTNPPYNSAKGFVEQGASLANSKFALLLRLAFLEGADRARSIYKHCPPSRVWVFSERITFYPAGVEAKGTGTTAYAWFVWDKSSPSITELKWLPPGLRAKYT